MDLAPGQVVEGRYETVRRLGQGAFATVYEVRHLALQSSHALKVLDPQLALDADLRNRFLAEGRIQARLRHNHVVAVTDVVTQPVAGLVMEFVDGPSLDVWLAALSGPPDLKAVLSLMVPILDAVGAAHAEGIVHRDLKPENIIIGRNRRGQVKPMVTDFGIAKVLEGGMDVGKRKTVAGIRMGTLLYMSPEQVRAESEIDQRSDLFSLGAILYEIVTGRVAYDADSDFDSMRRIVDGEYEPPERVVGNLDPVVAACIRKAMAVKPEERFPDCESMAGLLSAAGGPGVKLPKKPTRSVAVTQHPEPVDPRPLAEDLREPEWLDEELGRQDAVPRGCAAGPLFAGLMCLMCLPGSGQALNGQFGKGFGLFFLTVFLTSVTGGVAWFFLAPMAAIDAYIIGNKKRRGQLVEKDEWF